MNTIIFFMSFLFGGTLSWALDLAWSFDKSTFGLYFFILSSLFYQFFSNEARK